MYLQRSRDDAHSRTTVLDFLAGNSYFTAIFNRKKKLKHVSKARKLSSGPESGHYNRGIVNAYGPVGKGILTGMQTELG